MSARGIQSLVDEVTKHLRCLTALDRDPFAGRLPASEVLMPMLLDKFPPALIRAWDTNIGPDAAEEEDNLQKFLEFAQWQANLLAKSNGEEAKPPAVKSEQRAPSSKPSRSDRRYGDRIRSTAAALAVVAAKGCPFCSGEHKAEECEKFLQADLSKRRDMVRIKEVCFRCLETGHMAKGCRGGRPCGEDGCRQLHHKLLHPSPRSESARSPRSERARQGLLAARGPPGGCLQTVRARAYGPDGNHVIVNCLFDTGAEVSFIRKDVADVLGLTGPHERCRLTTLGGRVGPERRWRRVEFRLGTAESSGRRGVGTLVQALVIPRVCGEVQRAPAESPEGTPARAVAEMGQRRREPLVVDVLVGIDYYYELVTGRIRRATGGSVAVETRLGWITCGRAARNRASEAGVFLLQGEGSNDDALRRFWEIEALGITPTEDSAADGTAAMKKLEEELHLDEGRYSVGLPWVPGGPALPNNYSHARRRLLALERRLSTREEDRLRYASVMKQYFDEGWAEPAPEASPLGRTWYLPHHAVYQGAGDERKCRVVFDGAAPYKGITLNRQLEAGPNLQIDLLRAILSFRRLRVGLQADIEKMYLQIRVRAEDRDACRFLWRDDEQKIRKYRLTRVCFGLTCSPFLAMGTVRLHANQNHGSAPRAAEEVLNNMYMDDLATSCDSVADARSLVDQLSSLLASGGFQLHKWASNEPDALQDLPLEKTTMGAGGRPWKTLGIYWERNEDYLTFVNPERRRPEGGDTKRQLLSVASGIFDPIGCLAPFLVRAKILFQSLWERGLDWDEPLPEDVERPWLAWKSELDDLPLIRLPRALVPIPLDHVKRIELHAFCDASERAYGAVVYLRVEPLSGPAWVRLAAAKTRVAPVKRLSLPRLELMGALMAARLICYVQEALRLDIRSISCWSDSEVTLAWIQSAASQWKPFVRNRVEEIQQLVEPTCWRHCPGKSNPADVLSRGASLKGLSKNRCWWQGPKWLAEPMETWPRKRGQSERKPPSPPDEDRSPTLLISVVTHNPDHVLDPGRYGDIEKLFRITALCLRFGHNCGSVSEDRRTGPLTAPELEAAEQIWVRIAQRQGFPKEIEALKRNGNVHARSELGPLNPYLDAAGTLR
ncbi:zinc knuckle protein, partial [Trichinella spiralis]|uniref:zinc knuckle protein n=5 Tax=Trichinella spiralis TaxID=6334 RepID=UPI0001EFDC59